MLKSAKIKNPYITREPCKYSTLQFCMHGHLLTSLGQSQYKHRGTQRIKSYCNWVRCQPFVKKWFGCKMLVCVLVVIGNSVCPGIMPNNKLYKWYLCNYCKIDDSKNHEKKSWIICSSLLIKVMRIFTGFAKAERKWMQKRFSGF